MNNNFEEKIKELRKGYLNKLRDMLLDFKPLLADEIININEIYTKVHTISGTSGMYGIGDLSNVSTEFEFYLKPLKENPENINSEEFKKKFSDYLDYLEVVLSTGETYD